MSQGDFALKDSSVEWLGRVPEHWRIARLKWSIAGCINGIWGEEPVGEDDLLCVRVADFDRASLRVSLKKPTYRSVSKSERVGRMLNVGDLLLEKSGGGIKQLVGCVVLYHHEVPAVCSNFVGRVVPAENADPAYWTYVHQALYAGKLNYPAIKQTTGIQNLDADAYFDTPAAFPPLDEQVSISGYLDSETARIDKLIRLQESLTERLDEYRTALITRVVTKGLPPEAAEAVGLDPAPALKDSGVEWIGEVPEHWEIKSLVRAVIFQRGHDLPNDVREPGTVPVVSSAGVSGHHAEAAATGPAIVTGRYGSIGDFYAIDGPFWPLNTSLYSIDLRGNDVMFLIFLLRSLKPLFIANAAKSAVPGVDRNDIHGIQVAIPGREEQEVIAGYLKTMSERIDALRAKAELSIERLSEYRSALVSAAVTGKIDVREAALAGAGGGV